MSKKDYNKYLRSPEWKAKKLLVLERDNYKCQQCGYTNNLHVHHLTYENVTNEQLDDLVTLCKRCHRSEHKKKVKNTKLLLLRPFVHALLINLAIICSDILPQTPGGVATTNVVANRWSLWKFSGNYGANHMVIHKPFSSLCSKQQCMCT